ncbi:MAG TPA: sulfatase [Clostridia bacterium]|nr:sulfatase [Clostridia bacterium]
MNIIYMHTHDTGRYISPYGYDVPTPNLMELAKEGTVFRHAFSAAPTCSPSRSALLTGLYPHTNGMFGLAHRGFRLHDIKSHIVNLLNQNNVETVLCGVQHLVHPDPCEIGYQRIITKKPNETDGGHQDIDEQNARSVASYLMEKKDNPFFLSFGMVNTHRDWPDAESEINDNYVMPPFPIYDNAGARKDYAAYLVSAKKADRAVGIVMDALAKSGHHEDTMVIFTTDHGLAYPNMKCNLYDTGIGVSLIIKYPGNPKKGLAVDALVSHLDLFPTICEAMGVAVPSNVQGSSLFPVLSGERDEIRDEIHAEVTFHAVYEPMRCIRTKRFKLIRYFGDGEYHPSNIDGSTVKDFMAEHGFLRQKHPALLLFDLYLDPVERINLAGNESYSDILEELKVRLENWMKRTNDPLLTGRIEKPAGAIVNKGSCYSPRTEDFE